ncbi:MAG: hypothetical protein ACOX1S_01480 [Anaerostipes sp.]|jgi:Co/Zn/Cd efflux system component|nr:hypothetical protein [Anaerostipes sp.]
MKKSRMEKLLWIIMLLICILAAFCAWIGRFFQPIENYYRISVILSGFSLAINGMSYFYFNKELQRNRHYVFTPTLIGLALYTLVIVLQCFGILHLGILSEESKTLWMGVPILSFVWETRIIWGSIEFGKKTKQE